MRDRQHWPKPGTVQTGPVNTSSCNSWTPHHMNISDLGFDMPDVPDMPKSIRLYGSCVW